MVKKKLEEICEWKEIMNNPKQNYINKYECESCKGKNKKCSAYYVMGVGNNV